MATTGAGATFEPTTGPPPDAAACKCTEKQLHLRKRRMTMTTPAPAAAHAKTDTTTGGLHPGGEMAAGIMTTAAGEISEAGAITRPDRRPLPGGTAETTTAGGNTKEGDRIVQAANQKRAETGKIATADTDRAPRGQPMARGTGGGAGIRDDTNAGSSHDYVTTAIDASPSTGT
jgi:hypothetical protein